MAHLSMFMSSFNSVPTKIIWNLSTVKEKRTIQAVVFWFMTPCSGMIGYQRFGGPYCLHLHWVVTPCSVMIGYQRFGGPYCLHLHWVVMPHSDVVGCQRFGGPCCLLLQGEVKSLIRKNKPAIEFQ
jgi:hypothetical protein